MRLKTIVVGGEHLSPQQEKLRKIFMYLVSGVITTAVNWACYIAFDKLVKADMTIDAFGNQVSLKFVINQIVCWIISVIVAYFLNRITVFRSKGNIIRELFAFAGARVISFIILEIGLYSLMIFGCTALTGKPVDTPFLMIGTFAFTYEYLVKLVNSVFIVIANYVMSKLMVFKSSDMVDYNAEEKESSEKEEADALQ
ncbi:MAG: GtrA family protein [Ruminococcaceae bacterium]|nr:GtrA family protein [Oscillospiraceae bacterium]